MYSEMRTDELQTFIYHILRTHSEDKPFYLVRTGRTQVWVDVVEVLSYMSEHAHWTVAALIEATRIKNTEIKL